MKVGILGDNHGNHHSLSVVLEDMKLNGVDKLIFLGDLLFWGADPQRCYDTMKQLNPMVWIKGNTDNWFNEIDESFIPCDDQEIKIYNEFLRVTEQLSSEAIEYIKCLPERREIVIAPTMQTIFRQ